MSVWATRTYNRVIWLRSCSLKFPSKRESRPPRRSRALKRGKASFLGFLTQLGFLLVGNLFVAINIALLSDSGLDFSSESL